MNRVAGEGEETEVRIRNGPRVGAAIVVLLLFLLCIAADKAHASVIETSDIVALSTGMTGSGNGTLDLRMFTFSGSEVKNTCGTLNFDNANNTLPSGLGSADTGSFSESYVTTAGELKAYYNLNFPAGSIDEIVLFLDLSESEKLNNRLAELDVILNPTIQGAPNALGDVACATQAAINQVYSGGTTITNLNPQPAANLPIFGQGAGFADYGIFTGINPFLLNDNDVLLFNISMNLLSDGAEEIFLSGTYSGNDIVGPPVPAPAGLSLSLLGLGGLVLIRRRRK